MLVLDCMTRHPVMTPPETLATEAQRIMAENRIRHLPVVGDGKRLLGLITRQRLALQPDVLSSLNVWEITRYLAGITVKDVMLPAKDVITISQEKTVERAAKLLADNKIGCLPVIEDGVVIGILSEVDLLHSYQQMLGMPAPGVRLTIRMLDRKGEFARLMRILGDNQLGVVGVGTYPTRRKPGYYDAVIKIPNTTSDMLEEIFNLEADLDIVDIREAV